MIFLLKYDHGNFFSTDSPTAEKQTAHNEIMGFVCRNRSRAVFMCALVSLLWTTSAHASFDRSSLFLLEYGFINSTGHHVSPAGIWNIQYDDKLTFDIGAKARIQSDQLSTLTYIMNLKWLPFGFMGITVGFYHKDYYYMDVGEDLVYIGPAFRFPIGNRSWIGIEGGFNYRAFRLGGNYAIPFSFTGDGREYNYFTVIELMMNYDSVSWRFALQDKDRFTMYRFQSLGIDNTIYFHRSGTTSFLIGAELRLSGIFIGATTINHISLYGGVEF